MDINTGQTWRFTTHTGPAQQVYLAVDGPTTPSRWIAMQPVTGEPGTWSAIANILPGQDRLRYFTVDNGTTLNCGSIGLLGTRTSKPSPAVQIDDISRLGALA